MAAAGTGPRGETVRTDVCPTTLSTEEIVAWAQRVAADNALLKKLLAIERLRRITAANERDRLMARRGVR